MSSRRKACRLDIFFKTLFPKIHDYLFKHTPRGHSHHTWRILNCVWFYTKTDTLKKNIFFSQQTLKEWNELNTKICLLKFYVSFKREIFQKIRPLVRPLLLLLLKLLLLFPSYYYFFYFVFFIFIFICCFIALLCFNAIRVNSCLQLCLFCSLLYFDHNFLFLGIMTCAILCDLPNQRYHWILSRYNNDHCNQIWQGTAHLASPKQKW